MKRIAEVSMLPEIAAASTSCGVGEMPLFMPEIEQAACRL